MSREYYSPLRYPGGKGKVSRFFKHIFRENALCDGVYIEPFAGGASVALSLLLDEFASRVVINDIDRSIYAFWYSVLNRTEKLCNLIRTTPVSIQTWREQRLVQREKAKANLLELGFSTFFLNRTNRSGIIEAGVIGGLEQAGKWKIDARYNKDELIRRIQRVAQYKTRINLFNCDALDLISSSRLSFPKKSLYYLDPPYYVRGKELYLNAYEHEDHREIARRIKEFDSHNWILTYDNVEQIRSFYSDLRCEVFKLSYSAGAKSRRGEELMIFSPEINYSRFELPSC